MGQFLKNLDSNFNWLSKRLSLLNKFKDTLIWENDKKNGIIGAKLIKVIKINNYSVMKYFQQLKTQ